MKQEKLQEIAALAEKVGHILVATADNEGQPHVAAARRLAVTSNSLLEVREWFCPSTVANLKTNPRMSLVVWDTTEDTGYQLTGGLEEIHDVEMLNGYAPQIEREKAVPQVERQLLIRTKKITEFKCAPHSDIEE